MKKMQISNAELGSGAYGRVLYGKIAGEKCAIKKTPFRLIGDADFQACIREIVAANLVVAPNVQPISHIGISNSAIYVASPIRACSLAAYVASCDGFVPPNIVRQMTYELVVGLKAQHDAGLAHRDIKPHNILVDNDGHLRYIDFGASRLTSMPAKLHTLKCTATTRSPEEFLDLPCGLASDLWSLGMTIMFIALGNLDLGMKMDGGCRKNVAEDDDEFQYFTAVLSRMLFPSPDEWPEAWSIIDRRYSRISKFMRTKIAKRSGTPSAVGYLRRIMRRRCDLPPEFFDFIAGFLQGKPDNRMSLEKALTHSYLADVGTTSIVVPTSTIHEIEYELVEFDVKIFTMRRDLVISSNPLATHPALDMEMLIAMKKWLIESIVRFKFCSETLDVGLELIDRYLSWTHDVSKDNLQTIGIACMLLSANIFQDEDTNIHKWIAIYPKVSCLKLSATIVDIMIKLCGQFV